LSCKSRPISQVWGKALPAGRGRGIALCIGFGSFIAQVLEVAVAEGEVKVTRVVCATDCGMIVNPVFAATGRRVRKLPVANQVTSA